MQNGFQPVGRLVGYDLKPRLAGMIFLDETEQFPPPDDCFRYIPLYSWFLARECD